MRFAILRMQKLKSPVAVRRSLMHAFREQDTPNADPARTPDNTHMGANSAREALDKFGALLPEKRRRDAVLCVEYLITASPEAMAGKGREAQDRYFRDAVQWLQQRHGAENVVYAGIHRDETTPHLYAYVVPRDPDTGRLNAKRWFSGAKALAEMQSDFAERVGKQHGLERGIEGSKARHTTIRQFYAALEGGQPEHVRLEASDVQPQVTRKGMFRDEVESPQALAARLTSTVRASYQPAVEAAAGARELAKKAKEAQATALDIRKRAAPALDAFRPLTPENQAKLLEGLRRGSKMLQEEQEKGRKTVQEKRQPDGKER